MLVVRCGEIARVVSCARNVANYFVTGATGFIGGEIVKQLTSRGHRVVALVGSPEKASLLKALGVEMHGGDLTDRDTLRATSSRPCGRLRFHALSTWLKLGETHGETQPASLLRKP